MNIQFLQHVPYESPGILEEWARSLTSSVNISKLYSDYKLTSPPDTDLLIIMGGPMGVHDEDEHSWLAEEKEYIKECLKEQVKIVGICLGAQLIANVLGGKVYPNKEREIGWYPIEWEHKALKLPLFEFLPKQQKVLHWHGDTFEIPGNAINLAVSSACKRQGFLFNNSVLGLQFHLEMTPHSLRELIQHSREELIRDGKFVQTVEKMLSGDRLFEQANKSMIELMNRFLGVKSRV